MGTRIFLFGDLVFEVFVRSMIAEAQGGNCRKGGKGERKLMEKSLWVPLWAYEALHKVKTASCYAYQ